MGDREGQRKWVSQRRAALFSLGWKITESSKATVLRLWHWHLWLKALHFRLFCFRYFHINSLSMPTRNIASVPQTHLSGFASFHLGTELKPRAPPPASASNHPNVKGKQGLSRSGFLGQLHKYRECGSRFLSSPLKRGQLLTISHSYLDLLFLMSLSREKLQQLWRNWHLTRTVHKPSVNMICP